jgi:hypothetical protein
MWFTLSCTLCMGQVAVTTYHNDSYRTGANTNETILSTSNVNVQMFGWRFILPVQGYVYAQPLYVSNLNVGGTVHNVLFAATEHDQVYAFDVNNGQQLWHVSFLTSTSPQRFVSTVSSSEVGCYDLIPEIGITGTPVIDLNTNILYVVAKTKEYDTITKATSFYLTLHAVDVTTGKDKLPPHRITAKVPGNGSGSLGGLLTFDR